MNYNWNSEMEASVLEINGHKERNRTFGKAQEDLETFLYHSSHEMRAPLASILGLTNLIKFEGGNINQLKSYAQMIEERAQHMTVLLRDLAEITYNSSSSISISEFNIEKELKEILKEFNHIIDVNIFYKVKGKKKVCTDLARLRIVVRNLISNSIKFRDRSKTSFVDIVFESDSEFINMIIEDNGVGIGSEQLGKIFNPYYKANGNFHGNGLGLYLVKEIIDKLGGSIDLQSTLYIGTYAVVKLRNVANSSIKV